MSVPRRPRLLQTIPAAGSSIAAGDDTGRQARREHRSLLNELQRLRRRTSQQEESLARLAATVRILRRAGRALRAENRELRLAVQERRRMESRRRHPGANPWRAGAGLR